MRLCSVIYALRVIRSELHKISEYFMVDFKILCLLNYFKALKLPIKDPFMQSHMLTLQNPWFIYGISCSYKQQKKKTTTVRLQYDSYLSSEAKLVSTIYLRLKILSGYMLL